jgi:cell wall-associated NlpC family hydrolase
MAPAGTDDIIREARTWIGTRFAHQGRVKRNAINNGGVDCAGLIVGVAQSLGLSSFDYKGYSREPLGGMLQKILEDHLEQVSIKHMQPGDVLLMKFLHEPQHLGFCAGETVIHSYETVGKCIEHRIDERWKNRIVAVYRFRGLA